MTRRAPGNWMCPDCQFVNTRYWGNCKRCGADRPDDAALAQAEEQAAIAPHSALQQRTGNDRFIRTVIVLVAVLLIIACLLAIRWPTLMTAFWWR